jgi:Secretion system C-terminal sorting domain
MILHFSSIAQGPSPVTSGTIPGPNGTTLSYRSYDIPLSGTGYGTYNLSFPQWNPDSGTLAAVRIRALVTVQYGFTLKDVDVVPSSYTVSAGREDQFLSPALTTPYNNIFQQTIGTYPLNPGNSMTKSSFAFMDNYANTDSITENIAPFQGVDSVSFTYLPITYTDILTNNNSSYYYSAHVLDTVQFSLTYFYYPGTVLGINLTDFSALLVDQSTVQLAWTAVNEPAGRQYEIQAGRDGQQYATVSAPILAGAGGGVAGGPQNGAGGSQSAAGGSQNAGGDRQDAASYQQDYKLPFGSQGKWFFRLKITDAGGNISYSGIREVTVGGEASGNTLTLYPNPAVDFVNLSFGQLPAGDWQIDILNAAGNLVQRNIYPPTRIVQVDFQHTLAAGAYFVRAMDMQSAKTCIASMVIR